MNKLINFLKTTAYTVAIILSICLVFMVVVVSTASEPTALEREQARIQWIAEHGQYQPNLAEPAKQEAIAYTEQKQKELDDAKSRN